VTIPCTLILIVHMVPTSKLAAAAAQGPLDGGAIGGLRMQLIGDSASAVFVLLVMTALSMYKPRGQTAFGAARARTQAARHRTAELDQRVAMGRCRARRGVYCGAPYRQRDGSRFALTLRRVLSSNMPAPSQWLSAVSDPASWKRRCAARSQGKQRWSCLNPDQPSTGAGCGRVIDSHRQSCELPSTQARRPGLQINPQIRNPPAYP